MPEPAWTRLIAVADCPVDTGRYVERDGMELAVFHLSDPDRLVVTRNSCPHAGGNLSAGPVAGGVVTCPWHHWTFDLGTGHCTLSDRVELRRFACELREGWVWADLAAT